MNYSTFGALGIRVSALSFGASSLGAVFHDIDERDGIAAVHAALDAGINLFDVAPAYGATRAETVLGKALKGIRRDRYYLSTKAGKQTDPKAYGMDIFDYSRASIIASLDASMHRLGVDYLDIVHLHDFEYEHCRYAESALGEGIETLAELKRNGRIGGISAGIYDLALWKRVLRDAPLDAALIHNHYCLNDTTLLELLPICEERKIGVINGSPFASGLLTERGAPAWHPARIADRNIFKEAAAYCEAQGTTISKVALQFSVGNPRIPTTLFSTSRREAVERNLRWYGEPGDPELTREVQRILAPVMNKQWDYSLKPEQQT